MRNLCLICLFGALLTACASSSGTPSAPDWKNLTEQDFRVEVEEKTGPQDSWIYSGSSQTHHYFYRSPGRMFVGSYSYFTVSKEDYRGIARGEEVPFNGKAVFRSLAFSKLKKDRSGFTHSLSRGLVDNVLKP
jgi:hypothetical protein